MSAPTAVAARPDRYPHVVDSFDHAISGARRVVHLVDHLFIQPWSFT